MCVTHIPSPIDNARRKIEHIYTGPLDTELVESMFECSPEVWFNGLTLLNEYSWLVWCQVGMADSHGTDQGFELTELEIVGFIRYY